MTHASYNITIESLLGEPPAEPSVSGRAVPAQNEDFALFETLVREYCGVGFFECLGYPDREFLTSALWEESGMRPPRLCRIVVELLHLAAEQEHTR